MKLATTTGDFDRFFDNHIERIEHVYKAGFKYMDFNIYNTNDAVYDDTTWEKTVTEIKEYANSRGIKFVQAHSANTNNLWNEEYYQDAIKKTSRALEVCRILEIPNLVIHPGMQDVNKNEWFKENRKFFQALFPSMEKNNVNLLCENSTKANMGSWYYLFTGEDMREFIEYVNHPLFHGCWDTGHALIEGSQYKDITTLGDEMYAIHFHDNDAKGDFHTLPFLGNLNVDEIIQALIAIDFKFPLTFEANMALKPAWLKNNKFENDNCHFKEPSLYLQDEIEQFMFKMGKHILTTYNCYEE